MAESILSPGVFTRENDISFIQPAPVEAGAAFIGPAVKGPIEVPTVVTSYGQYRNIFGETFRFENNKEEFLTSIAVRNYFEQGGTTALITRVVRDSQAFSPAESTTIKSQEYETSGSFASGSQPFVLETLGQGDLFNNALDADTIETGFNNTLVSGSRDNIRWQITGVDEDTGTFNLLIRRGDDSDNQPVILETFAGVSLDPDSNNYIARRVGDIETTKEGSKDDLRIEEIGEFPNRSNFVRVKEVNLKTFQYLDNNADVGKFDNGTPYSEALPQEGDGGFFGGSGSVAPSGSILYNNFVSNNVQGLDPTDKDYDDAIKLLANRDDYQFNIITAPGLISEVHNTTVQKVFQLAESRGDTIAVIDLVDYGTDIGNVTAEAGSINSSYAATYWPFLQTNVAGGKNKFVPPSTLIPGVYAFTDNLSAPWFAPAGLTRGGIPGVIKAERKLTKANRDELYKSNVNPIASFPGSGISVFGQKTLQKRASALDRVNVRRLLIELKKFFSDQARNLVFEQNTNATRNRFLSAVNPFMESVVQRQGLFAFRVVMDETNNTADVIDRNQLIGQVFIQPTRTAEFIVLDFTVEPTGATFDV